jgi:microcystin-dependent protein
MGRTPVGFGAGSGLTDRSTIGAKFGAETHTLSVNEMPSHNHPFNASDGLGAVGRTHFMDRNVSHSHGDNLGNGYARSYGATYGADGNHTHNVNGASTNNNSHDHSSATLSENAAESPDPGTAATLSNAAAAAGAHQHSTYIDMYFTDINHRHTIEAQGGGAAHNNMQPSTVVNFIIKT